MKIAVFIDHDVVCRHFVMSGALDALRAAHDVVFVFPDDGGRRVKLSPDSLGLAGAWTRLPIDSTRQQIWRWLLFADQLRLRPGAHEAAVRRLRWMTLGWKAAALLTLAGLPVLSTLFERYAQKRLAERPNAALATFLEAGKFDAILHPSVLEGLFINDLVASCHALAIPLVVAMNSWDNPSTKRAVVGKPDRILVWGPQTQAHCIRFIGMAPAHVVAFGVPQFEVFANPPREDRSAFCARLGIDPANRLFLFAGANTQTDEVATLKELDRAVGEGRLPNAKIVYRPHPWGGGGQGGARLASLDLAHVVFDPTMQAYIEGLAKGDRAMMLPDYRDSHDLLSHVDAVVSPMSTILLEAALHGKPVVAFAPTDMLAGASVAMSLPMLHFENFLALPDVAVASDTQTLLAAMAALVDPEIAAARGAALKQAATGFATPYDRPWGVRLVEFVERLAAGWNGAAK